MNAETKIAVIPADDFLQLINAVLHKLEIIDEKLGTSNQNNNKFVHGLRDICKLTGESITTVSRKVKKGIYKNMSGNGSIVVRYDELPIKANV